ncbi:MAG: hypothetical protein WCI05_14160, partial [Myxococcales bacterium]
MSSLRLMLVLLLSLLLFAPTVHAAGPLDPKEIPDPLRPWLPWVLHGKEQTRCPILHATETARCSWPARLDLVVDERGGRFSQRWHLDARAWIPLPGDDKRWPQTVEVNAKRAVVVAQNGVPSVEHEPGDHWVTGAFLWDSPPEAIPIPAETGLVALTLRGKLVESPTRDAVVWLQRAATKEEGDKLEFVVHRHVDDNVPLRLTTRIELNVAGKNREVLLGKALPQGFRPLALE